MDRYMMFELYQLEKSTKDAYACYRFPQGTDDPRETNLVRTLIC